MFNADTVCSDVNESVHNESAIVQFSSAIYCLCVLTEQQMDRRNIKYKQQTETHRQQVITNYTLNNSLLASERKKQKRPKYKYNTGKHSLGSIQKTAIMESSHIIRKVLQTETSALWGGDSRWFGEGKYYGEEACDRVPKNNNDIDNNNNVTKNWYRFSVYEKVKKRKWPVTK
jgi:hypothetical protein